MEHGIRSTGRSEYTSLTAGDVTKLCDGANINEVASNGPYILYGCKHCGWSKVTHGKVGAAYLLECHQSERTEYTATKTRGASLFPPTATKPATTTPDKSRPTHYQGDYAMRVIEDFDLKGAMVLAAKHILRNGHKEGESELDDAKKALWYVRRRVWELQCQEANELGRDKPEWREE